MSNINNFSTKENLTMLWEILLDELNLNSNNIKLITNIKTIFDSNINPFLLRANKNSNIMLLNKQFLGQVVLAVSRLIPTLKQDQNIKKIKISDEEILEPYKIEDIHASRQTNFEKEVERKKLDFDSYLVPIKPKNLDFSVNNKNNPLNSKIIEIGPLLAEKMAERNFDLEQIQNSNYNVSSMNPESWLKSKETSVKTDEKEFKTSLINQKKVSFSDLKEIETTKSIFQKLKKNINEPLIDNDSDIFAQSIIDLNLVNNIEIENNAEKYIEQKSMSLPDYNTDNRQRNSLSNINTNTTTNTNTNSNSIIQNIPIIPNNEFIKQINEINCKIDSLYDIVNSLANTIKLSMSIKDSIQDSDCIE